MLSEAPDSTPTLHYPHLLFKAPRKRDRTLLRSIHSVKGQGSCTHTHACSSQVDSADGKLEMAKKQQSVKIGQETAVSKNWPRNSSQ